MSLTYEEMAAPFTHFVGGAIDGVGNTFGRATATFLADLNC